MRFRLLKKIGLITPQEEDKAYFFIRQLLGCYPVNMDLYTLAFTHKSNTTNKTSHYSNERLEFLGDAVLDTIVSDILYKRFPYKTEGELTQYRSNIVKRTSLNKIAISLGLSELLISAPNANISSRMYGDLLEAFVGAIYLDKGYKVTFRFVHNKIIQDLMSTEEMVKVRNYKSKLLEWGQQHKKTIQFTESKDPENDSYFISDILIENKIKAQGRGKTKKESHNEAAKKVLAEMKAKTKTKKKD